MRLYLYQACKRLTSIVLLLVSLLCITIFHNQSAFAQTYPELHAPPNYSSAQISQITTKNSNNPEIRVLLGDKFNSITIYFQKGYRVYNDQGGLLEEALEATSANIVALPSRIKINNKPIEAKSMYFLPLSGGYTGFIKLKFRGAIRVLSSYNDKLAVVNHLPLEDYVKAVVPGEMPCTWSIEALKAQTVAARTYAVNRMMRNRKQNYDVSDGQEDQVYLGMTKEREQTNKAASDTAFVVATYNRQPIIAYFCSDAGGKTNQSDSLPYLKSVASYVAKSPHNGWGWQGSFVELENILKRKYPNSGLLINIVPELDPISNRMKRVEFITTSGSIKVSANTFRNLINPNKLKSTAFNISLQSGSSGMQLITYNARPDANCIDNSGIIASINVVGAKVIDRFEASTIINPPKILTIENSKEKMVIVKGNGWGHGSGLSQWGAYELAKKGWDWLKIIHYYYYGIELLPVNQIYMPLAASACPIGLGNNSINPAIEAIDVNQEVVQEQIQNKSEVKIPDKKDIDSAPKEKPKSPEPKENNEDNNNDDSPEPLPLPPGS